MVKKVVGLQPFGKSLRIFAQENMFNQELE